MDPSVRDSLDSVAALRVAGREGTVSLGSVAKVAIGSGPTEINRIDRSRNVTFSVELNGRPLGAVQKEAMSLPALRLLPANVHLVEQGEAQRMSEMFTSFGLAMGVGVFCIYATLVLLFHDFLQPATILGALPLALGGALFALWITHQSFYDAGGHQRADVDGHRDEEFDSCRGICHRCAPKTWRQPGHIAASKGPCVAYRTKTCDHAPHTRDPRRPRVALRVRIPAALRPWFPTEPSTGLRTHFPPPACASMAAMVMPCFSIRPRIFKRSSEDCFRIGVSACVCSFAILACVFSSVPTTKLWATH